MIHIYFLLLFLIQASAKQIRCISNAKFVSQDIMIIQTNFTFDQCVCYQWYYNYSSFNYFTQNLTCELFQNFTTDFLLLTNNSTRFCFNSPPIRPSPILTTNSLVTSAFNSSVADTTIFPDVTTAVDELKWDSTGITVATGNGNSSILNPYGVFVDDQYYIYIAEKGNSRISKWPPTSNGVAPAAIFQTANAQLNQPPSLYVNVTTGDIYVADESNFRVMFFANGSTIGSSVTGALSGTSPGVSAIYLDPNGTIFVADANENRIYNWFTNETMAGGQGGGGNANQLNGPKRFYIDSNYSFYIADANNARVQKWSRGATSGETVAGGYGSGPNANQLSAPLAVVVDSQQSVLVCDSANNRVQRWRLNATTGETIAGNSDGTAGSGPNELNSPKGIALDKDNNLYVADLNNYRIQKFNCL